MARYGEPPFRYRVPPPKREITERDQQAMYNFADEPNYVSPETIAENYECSAECVQKVIDTRPWLRSKSHERKSVNLTWWESNHSDPLELVKLFYPDYCVSSEVSVEEKREAMTWEEYYDSMDEQALQELYREGGQSAIDAFYERVQEMAALEGIELTFTFAA